MLGIPTLKGVIEDEEVIKEIQKYLEVGKESRELCQGSQRGQHFNNNNVIIIADITRALAMCQALSPELYTLTCLGGRLLFIITSLLGTQRH